NTIKKVTIVVLVLMINCQVSEKPRTGPHSAHTTSTATAARNVHGPPVRPATRRDNRSNASHIEPTSHEYPDACRSNPVNRPGFVGGSGYLIPTIGWSGCWAA